MSPDGVGVAAEHRKVHRLDFCSPAPKRPLHSAASPVLVLRGYDEQSSYPSYPEGPDPTGLVTVGPLGGRTVLQCSLPRPGNPLFARRARSERPLTVAHRLRKTRHTLPGRPPERP